MAMGRSIAGIVVEGILAVVLSLLLGAALVLLAGTPPDAVVAETVRLILVFMDIGIVTWLALRLVGVLRHRGIGWGVRGSLVAAVVGVLVNLLWIVILSVAGGGLDPAAILLGVEAGVVFLVAVAVAAPLMRYWLPERKPNRT